MKSSRLRRNTGLKTSPRTVSHLVNCPLPEPSAPDAAQQGAHCSMRGNNFPCWWSCLVSEPPPMQFPLMKTLGTCTNSVTTSATKSERHPGVMRWLLINNGFVFLFFRHTTSKLAWKHFYEVYIENQFKPRQKHAAITVQSFYWWWKSGFPPTEAHCVTVHLHKCCILFHFIPSSWSWNHNLDLSSMTVVFTKVNKSSLQSLHLYDVKANGQWINLHA